MIKGGFTKNSLFYQQHVDEPLKSNIALAALTISRFLNYVFFFYW